MPMPPQNGASGKNTGSVIGIVIIVIVLAFGGFYFWGKRLSEEPSVPDAAGLSNEKSMPVPGSAADEMSVGGEEI